MSLKHLAIAVALWFFNPVNVKGQSFSAETLVTIPIGSYTANDIVLRLKEQKIEISYASAALTKADVTIVMQTNTLYFILSKLFDPSKYSFVYKKDKVIVRIKQANTSTKNIMGYVEEAKSGERLIGANVYIPSLNLGTITNAFGYFSITLDATDTVLLSAGALGYSTITKTAYPKNEAYYFKLETKPEQLATVEISSKPVFTELTQMSSAQFTTDFTKRTPSFLGEADILKTVQTLPGVQGGMEGATGLFIRGGSADQNLLLLDGVPVYNASHLFGLFSVFNADAIKNVSLIKGGFPARYGGRLSSVLNIDMKEGNLQEYHGNGSIGLISSRLTLEGPIIKDKMSFMVSGRRTYWDLLVKGIQNARGAEPIFNYHFNDVNAKVNYILDKKNRLYLSFYTGGDLLVLSPELVGGDDDENIRIGWGNRTTAFRWNHIYNNHLFGNLTATYSGYKFYTKTNVNTILQEDIAVDYKSSIEDFGLKYDFEYQKFTRHKLRFGVNYFYHQSKPNTLLETDVFITSDLGATNAHDFYAYAEDDWYINENLKINVGGHYAHFIVENSTYNYLQPRVSARYLLNSNWSLKASYANMAQFIHLLSNEGSGLPTDLWVSSTDKVKPQLSDQFAIGTFHQLAQRTWEVSVEGFYKQMENLITYKDGTSFIGTADWQNAVETNGNGIAYGAEFYLKKLEGRTTGWISYTYAKSERQFENINQGNPYPFRFDRRHNTSIVLNHEFSKRFDIGLNWTFATGQAFSLPTSSYYLINPTTGNPQLYTDYSERNQYRYPNYHRLDLSMNFRKKTKWGERTWNISIYNAYNKQNPFYVELNLIDNQIKAEQLSLFPILPSVSYVFEF